MLDHSISALKLPGNSLDPIHIENRWIQMKVSLKNKDMASIPRLKTELTKLWVNMDIDYFLKLADFMPKRIRDVIDLKGGCDEVLITMLNKYFIAYITFLLT